jgi:hypothetical protein
VPALGQHKRKADCRGGDKGEDESGQVRGPVFNDFPTWLLIIAALSARKNNILR